MKLLSEFFVGILSSIKKYLTNVGKTGYSVVNMNMNFYVRENGFKSQFCDVLGLWYWASSLAHSVLLCKMEKIIAAISELVMRIKIILVKCKDII